MGEVQMEEALKNKLQPSIVVRFKKSNINLPWFKRIGIFFIPASIIGWLITLGCLFYAVYTFIDIDSRSHSVSDTLMNFVFRLLIIGVVYSQIAYFTSYKPKK